MQQAKSYYMAGRATEVKMLENWREKYDISSVIYLVGGVVKNTF
jgi:hypothetical protein